MIQQLAKVKSESSKDSSNLPLSLSPLKKKTSVNQQSFNNKGKIGKGAYGDVYLVEKDQKLYAMKQIGKHKLSKQKKQYQALVQRQLLSKMKHPGIIQLHFTFQDKQNLFFILEYCEGGNFTQFIKLNYKKLSHQIKVFYIAQIVQVLEYLHTHGITHRDLKPQNLLLSKHGHIKFIDFGTADFSKSDLVSQDFKQKICKSKKQSQSDQKQRKQKQKEEEQQQTANQIAENQDSQNTNSPRKPYRRATFVGTPYYISPELLQENMCEPPSDLWALGCIIYQMFYLDSPFKDGYQYFVYQKIKSAKVQFPKNQYITEQAVDLIKRLIVKDPYQRLGCGQTPQLSYDKLKAHPFFKGIKFKKIFQQPLPDTKQQSEMKQEEMQINAEKIQRTKTQMQKIINKQLNLGQQKDKILIHGVLEKKTFITYAMYYFIIYNDLTVKRIKCDSLEKEKLIRIRYKAPLNLSSSIKLIKSQTGQIKNAQQSCNTSSLPCKIIGNTKFQLIADDKTYNLKASSPQQALKWINAINERAKVLRNQWIMNNSDSD